MINHNKNGVRLLGYAPLDFTPFEIVYIMLY